jgi:hypothetical protein
VQSEACQDARRPFIWHGKQLGLCKSIICRVWHTPLAEVISWLLPLPFTENNQALALKSPALLFCLARHVSLISADSASPGAAGIAKSSI